GGEGSAATQPDARQEGHRWRSGGWHVEDAAGPEGLCALARLLPAARRDLHDGLLAADADPELGRQGPADDWHLRRDPQRRRILIGRNSDRHHERRWHFAACVAIGAIGLFI